MLNLINYLKIYGFTKFVLKLLRYPFLKIYRYNMKKKYIIVKIQKLFLQIFIIIIGGDLLKVKVVLVLHI